MIYRLAGAWPAAAAQLEEALAREPFAECGATQQKSCGWVPPRGAEHGALVEVVDGQWIARLAIETKFSGKVAQGNFAAATEAFEMVRALIGGACKESVNA